MANSLIARMDSPTTVALPALARKEIKMVDRTSGTPVSEIKLLSADLLTPVMTALVAVFERTTKYRVALVLATTGEVTQRVHAGESADVAIMQRPAMQRLVQEGKIIGSTIVDLGRSSVGVGVRAGAPKPDLTSVEGFIRSLMLAKSIGYTDPRRGGGSGVYFAKLLERLGLAEQLQSKIRYPRAGNSAADHIAEGEIDFGIAQPMEILAKREIELAGVLPRELQDPELFVYSAGILRESEQPDAAKSLIQSFSGAAAAVIIRSKGLDPS
jgi:molybdate transport system substrate-binding protein